MEKLIVLIHPLFYLRNKIFNGGSNKEIEEQINNSLTIYKKGIDFYEGGGSLIVFRPYTYAKILQPEQEIYDYASKHFNKMVHIYPDLNEREEADNQKDFELSNNFFINSFGSLENLKNVQFFGFGEDLAACVAWNLCRLKELYGLKNKPIIDTRYSLPSPDFLLEERIVELKRFFNKDLTIKL